MLKARPPEEAAVGAAGTSLLAAPKRKADGTVGAEGSFSVDKDPNVAPPGGVVDARLPNSDPVVVAEVVVFVDAVSCDEVTLLSFS